MVKHKETEIFVGIFVITVLVLLVLSISSLASSHNQNPTTLTSQEKRIYKEASKEFTGSGGIHPFKIFEAFEELPVEKSIAACEQKLVSRSRILCYRMLSTAKPEGRTEICSRITTELCNDFRSSSKIKCREQIQSQKLACELALPVIE